MPRPVAEDENDTRELGQSIARAAAAVGEATGDPRFAEMFLDCMTDTLTRTIDQRADGSVFVITGDIPAMWLRDSSAQLRPFLPFLSESAELRRIVAGLIRRQFASILIDPYANAFNDGPTGAAHDQDDLNDNPGIWERKYEIDSLAFPVQLLHRYWEATGDRRIFTEDVRRALELIVATWRTEQDHEANSDYRFERRGAPASETLERHGRGSPVSVTGMTWSGFRPSDDACVYGYNIPAQHFAASALRQIADIATVGYSDDGLAERALAIRSVILAGVEKHGLVRQADGTAAWAYEVDGRGNSLVMDDANMPSLLSLPLTSDISVDDPIYQATRRVVLSEANPYFYRGDAAEGIGSPHTPDGYIWHIGLAVQGLTTHDRAEKLRLLEVMRETDAGTGRMHEGFCKDDPTAFTRPWFSWANSMLCELLLDYAGLLPGAVTSR